MSEPRLALVTGGAGFIGSHLCAALLGRGMRVRVLDDLSSGSRAKLADLELQIGSVGDPQAVAAAMAGARWVFHLAAMVSVPGSVLDPPLCYHTNLIGSLNVLNAARAQGVDRVVLASSAAVYGESKSTVDEASPTEPRSPYAAAKLAMEQAAALYHRLYGLPTVCLRLFNVYGPGQSPASGYSAVIPAFIAAGLVGEPATIYGDGSQQRDFVYVEDVARAFALAADREQAIGKLFNIAGGRTLAIGDLAGILQKQMGSELRAVHGSPRSGDIDFSHASIEAARTGLAFAPEVDISEGLVSTVEWFRQEQALGTP